MYIQNTSTKSVTIVFGILIILSILCAWAYCRNFKKRRRQITSSPQRLPKAWYGVRQEFVIHQQQQPQEFV